MLAFDIDVPVFARAFIRDFIPNHKETDESPKNTKLNILKGMKKIEVKKIYFTQKNAAKINRRIALRVDSCINLCGIWQYIGKCGRHRKQCVVYARG